MQMAGCFATLLACLVVLACVNPSAATDTCTSIEKRIQKHGVCTDQTAGRQMDAGCRRAYFTYCKKGCTDTAAETPACSAFSGFEIKCDTFLKRWENKRCKMENGSPTCGRLFNKLEKAGCQDYAASVEVDGGFGAWSAWGACSASCGGGQRSRARTCDNPAPSNGGSDCAGDAAQQEGCGSELCPDPKTVCESVSGFRFYESGDHPAMCLRAIPARLTYDQARAKCREQGARLVMPKTRATLDFLFNVLPNDVTTNGHWVGLDDQEEEGRFVWGDDGSVLPLDSDLWRADRGAVHLEQHGVRDCVHTYTSPQAVHSLSDTHCVIGARPAVCHLTDF